MDSSLGYTPGAGATVATRQDGLSRHHQKAVVESVDASGEPQPVTAETPLPTQEVSGAHSLLQRILAVLLSPMGYDRSLGRQRSTAVIESGTVTTVSTVSNISAGTLTTVQGLTNIDGRNGSMLINQTNLSAWASTHRALIT